MTADKHPGTRWFELRRSLKMSRESFAARVGLTPGAVWRVEARGRFKPGEEEKLLAAFPDAVAHPFSSPGPAEFGGFSHKQTLVAYDESLRVSPVAHEPAPTYVWSSDGDDDDRLVLWLDVQPNIPVMLSAGAVSPVSASSSTVAVPVASLEPLEPSAVLTPFQRTQDDGITRISNSEIQTFKRCRRKWWFAYYRRLVPKVTDLSGVAVIGDRVHRALALWYVADVARRVDPRSAIEMIIELDRTVIRDVYLPDEVPLGVETTFRKESDLERIMIEGYVQWLAETGLDSDLQVLGSEQYLEADLPGVPGVRLVAKLDARLRRISDGIRMFMDHKTVGDLTGPVRVLPLNEQMLFYLLVESLQPDAERCAGAIYNMLRRVRRTSAATPPFYRRVEVYHNPVEVENFLVRTRGTVHEILRLREALDLGVDHRFVAYPSPSSDCSWSCRYVSIDGMVDDGSRVEDAIADHFTVGDPTGYYAR